MIKPEMLLVGRGFGAEGAIFWRGGRGFFVRGPFHALGGLGHAEVLLHEAARIGGPAGADRAVDFAVHLGGFAEVDGALDGFATLVVHGGGDGFHDGGEDGISGGLGDDAMEEHIVYEVLGGIFKGGKHLGDFLREQRVMLFSSALGGQGCETALKQDAGLEHLPGLKAVERAHEAERGFADVGRSIGYEGADAVANLHDAHGGEIADAGAEAGAADLEVAGELALGREFVAGLERATFNQGANVVDHLHGSVRFGHFRFNPRHRMHLLAD